MIVNLHADRQLCVLDRPATDRTAPPPDFGACHLQQMPQRITRTEIAAGALRIKVEMENRPAFFATPLGIAGGLLFGLFFCFVPQIAHGALLLVLTGRVNGKSALY